MVDAELEGDLVHELLLRKHLAFRSGALDGNLLGITSDPSVDLSKGTFSNGVFVAVCDFLQLTLREDVDAHALEYVTTVFVKKNLLCFRLLASKITRVARAMTINIAAATVKQDRLSVIQLHADNALFLPEINLC